ncbi:MAG: PEP-CTERM sorting domain-containing protein [Crocosphaera sp.]|nr:PEP-CTERM sorting domain-containing protein [Crocosphaera sp.]
MVKKLLVTGTLTSIALLITTPVNATNIKSGILRFTSDNPDLEQTSGTFQFDKGSSFFVEGRQIFALSSINIQTPFGTNYSDDDILLSIWDFEPNSRTIPVFSPSQNRLARLVIQLDFSDGGEPEEVLFFDTLDFQNPDPMSSTFTDSMSLSGDTYSESVISVLPFSGFDSGTYVATVVPEPLTVLGAVTALALGTGFKRELRKAKKR